MKNIILSLLLVLPVSLSAQYNSWDGCINGIAPNSHIRVLNFFVNIIYDVHPDTNYIPGTQEWPIATTPGINNEAIPSFLLDFMDTSYNDSSLHGTLTRLYGESSFDTLQITGDFMVVNIPESYILANDGFEEDSIPRAVVRFVNSMGGLNTIYGHNSISDYECNGSRSFYYTQFIIRNITRNYGGWNAGSGKGMSCLNSQDLLIVGNEMYPFTSKGNVQCVGDKNFVINPTNIVCHEISHSLFGGNNFHTSGGNHRFPDGTTMSFLNVQGGYGLMGAANSGLVCCNGYERWRMHWKHPQAVDYIAARNASNTQSVASDITREDGDMIFLLRDFITYGDAVRIRLPYKDKETSSNQYIWLENHQVGSNGKLDFLQYSNDFECRPQGAAGIYAYYQIGRDILSGRELQVWDRIDRDNLKIIPAEGYYDYEKVLENYNTLCVSYAPQEQTVIRGEANPLSGDHDQSLFLFPADSDSVLFLSAEQTMWRKRIGMDVNDSLPFLGDMRDPFRTHTRLNMGTNPSTCNTATCHSRNIVNSPSIKPFLSSKDTKTIYLTGLGIEMTPMPNGDFLISVRWDDYDITNDCRWTGNITLKDTAVIKTGNTITLAQNRTVARTTRNSETGLFSDRTFWTCEAGSLLRQDSASAIVLTEGSTLLFEGGSHFVQADSARLVVGTGCTLRFEDNADIVLRGTLEVDSGGVAYMTDTVGFGHSARIIVRPGGKLIVDGGTLTSACFGEMWQGIFVEGHSNLHQTEANQGKVVLRNGAVIENAICGIRTSAPDDSTITTGGIIKAFDATFHNNRRAVAFFPYADIISGTTVRDNFSGFSNCTFTIDDNNLFAANNTSFDTHATLWDVKGITFEGCTFTNATTAMNPDKGYAIMAIDAGFSVATLCDTVYPETVCQCPENKATHCLFSGFLTAISASTTGNAYFVSVDEAQFGNNGTGISVSGNNHVTVTRNDFDMNSLPGTLMEGTGLILNGCTGYVVEENNFHRTALSSNFPFEGICVESSGSAANSLYRNDFSHLQKAVRVVGSNRGMKIPVGLECSCNTFYGNQYDIYVAANSSMSPQQGSASVGADNHFSGTTASSLYNAGSYTISYYHSGTGIDMLPYNPTSNITVLGHATANPCLSTLCGNGGVLPPPGPIKSPDADYMAMKTQYDTLLSAYESRGYAGILANPSEDLHSQADILSARLAFAQLGELERELHTRSSNAVRALLRDTLLDLPALENWFAATPGLSSMYSLAETEYLSGESNALTLQGVPALLKTSEERDEYDNYMAFNALKEALSGYLNGHANWPSATETQILELQDIAAAGTGRSSVMARGVLCFFFGICDEEVVMAETRRAEAKDGNVCPEYSDVSMKIYPNPAGDVLHVEFEGTDDPQGTLTVTNIMGVVQYVETLHCGVSSNVFSIDVSNLTPGLYVVSFRNEKGVAVKKFVKNLKK